MALRPAITNQRGRKAGAIAAIFVVDVLDHLFAPLVLEIDVDIRRLAALFGDEAVEQKLIARGIDFRDAETIADGGIGRRAAPLAQDRDFRDAELILLRARQRTMSAR